MEEHRLSLHLQRVYPLGNGSIDRSCSSLALSSLSLSDQDSDDSLPDGSVPSWCRRVPATIGSRELRQWKKDGCVKERASQCHNYVGSGKIQDAHSFNSDIWRCRFNDLTVQHPGYKHQVFPISRQAAPAPSTNNDANLKRCNWITKSSDQVIVSFHDECWGVPVFNDRRLFELLSLSGLLIDHNWTEILKRRAQYREVFANFDHNVVANMEEEDIKKISSIKKLTLGERRVRCILDNAKCIQKVAKEYGSFSGYIWSHVNHRPTVNKLKHPKRSLAKTPKSKSISEDLVRRGFRQVGAVVVYSFMQAAGMVNDHDVGCFRLHECVKIAERSWGMTNIAM